MKRRDFIKITGAAAAAAALPACGEKKTSAPVAEEEKMGLRENPNNGDKVSLLGFGCMRWPMIEKDGTRVIDQEAVNEMVDYALAHGVNYFDTSPAYLMGQSEKAAGDALSRHPRESYYIATKLSNFGDRSTEASIKMYHDSFEQLHTDYFDYYLLHAVGRGGSKAFFDRYVENGMMDFLLAEKAAGRIRNLGFSFHGSQGEFDIGDINDRLDPEESQALEAELNGIVLAGREEDVLRESINKWKLDNLRIREKDIVNRMDLADESDMGQEMQESLARELMNIQQEIKKYGGKE